MVKGWESRAELANKRRDDARARKLARKVNNNFSDRSVISFLLKDKSIEKDSTKVEIWIEMPITDGDGQTDVISAWSMTKYQNTCAHWLREGACSKAKCKHSHELCLAHIFENAMSNLDMPTVGSSTINNHDRSRLSEEYSDYLVYCTSLEAASRTLEQIKSSVASSVLGAAKAKSKLRVKATRANKDTGPSDMTMEHQSRIRFVAVRGQCVLDWCDPQVWAAWMQTSRTVCGTIANGNSDSNSNKVTPMASRNGNILPVIEEASDSDLSDDNGDSDSDRSDSDRGDGDGYDNGNKLVSGIENIEMLSSSPIPTSFPSIFRSVCSSAIDSDSMSRFCPLQQLIIHGNTFTNSSRSFGGHRMDRYGHGYYNDTEIESNHTGHLIQQLCRISYQIFTYLSLRDILCGLGACNHTLYKCLQSTGPGNAYVFNLRANLRQQWLQENRENAKVSKKKNVKHCHGKKDGLARGGSCAKRGGCLR